MNEIIELAKKITALAEQGVGGEKVNARLMLERLCKKHNIDPDTLGEEQKTMCAFEATGITDQILVQIIYKVAGSKTKILARHGKKYGARAKVTEAQRLEILAMYQVYSRAFLDTLKLMETAFINKNDLFAEDAEEESDEEEEAMTPAQREENYRLGLMMEGLERTQFHKQLGSGSK